MKKRLVTLQKAKEEKENEENLKTFKPRVTQKRKKTEKKFLTCRRSEKKEK